MAGQDHDEKKIEGELLDRSRQFYPLEIFMNAKSGSVLQQHRQCKRCERATMASSHWLLGAVPSSSVPTLQRVKCQIGRNDYCPIRRMNVIRSEIGKAGGSKFYICRHTMSSSKGNC